MIPLRIHLIKSVVENTVGDRGYALEKREMKKLSNGPNRYRQRLLSPIELLKIQTRAF